MSEILKIDHETETPMVSLDTIKLVHEGVTDIFIEKLNDELAITLEFWDGHTETTKINWN